MQIEVQQRTKCKRGGILNENSPVLLNVKFPTL